jgi:copper chaperone CopZ
MNKHDNCHVEPVKKPLDKVALENAKAAYLMVSGMNCHNCAARVRNGLLAVEGVLLADVQLQMGVAAVVYDPQCANPDTLVQAIAAAGNDGRHHYEAEVVKIVSTHEALR